MRLLSIRYQDLNSSGTRINVDDQKMQYFQEVLQYHNRSIVKANKDEEARTQQALQMQQRKAAEKSPLDITIEEAKRLRRQRALRNKLGRQAAKEILTNECSGTRRSSFQPLSGMMVQSQPTISSCKSMPDLSRGRGGDFVSAQRRGRHGKVLQSSVDFIRFEPGA
jgi:hypothetical protein